MDSIHAAQEVCLQEQFTEQLVNSPLLAKIVVELMIWIFNFMFLRDIIFRRWSEV
jgi:hypothetical protein